MFLKIKDIKYHNNLYKYSRELDFMGIGNVLYRLGNSLVGFAEYTLYLGILDKYGEQYADNILFLGSVVGIGMLVCPDAVSRICFNQGVFGKNKINPEKENSLVKKVSLEKLSTQVNLL